jgi:hypothetical protein
MYAPYFRKWPSFPEPHLGYRLFTNLLDMRRTAGVPARSEQKLSLSFSCDVKISLSLLIISNQLNLLRFLGYRIYNKGGT